MVDEGIKYMRNDELAKARERERDKRQGSIFIRYINRGIKKLSRSNSKVFIMVADIFLHITHMRCELVM